MPPRGKGNKCYEDIAEQMGDLKSKLKHTVGPYLVMGAVSHCNRLARFLVHCQARHTISRGLHSYDVTNLSLHEVGSPCAMMPQDCDGLYL